MRWPRETSSGNTRAGETLAGSGELPSQVGSLSATPRMARGQFYIISCFFNANAVGKGVAMQRAEGVLSILH